MLINEIVVKEKEVNLPGNPVPIKHGKEVSLGNEKFVYDLNNNIWLRKSDGQAISQNSEAHMVLMATQGYEPDGVNTLSPGAWKTVKGTINNLIGGPLGVASRSDPNASLLGKISGVIGDGLQRLIRGNRNKAKAQIIKVGDTVQWNAEKNNKNIKKGDLVQGPVIAVAGDSYPAGIPSEGGSTEVPQGKLLIKSKTGVIFTKPIDRVQKVQG